MWEGKGRGINILIADKCKINKTEFTIFRIIYSCFLKKLCVK